MRFFKGAPGGPDQGGSGGREGLGDINERLGIGAGPAWGLPGGARRARISERSYPGSGSGQGCPQRISERGYHPKYPVSNVPGGVPGDGL